MVETFILFIWKDFLILFENQSVTLQSDHDFWFLSGTALQRDFALWNIFSLTRSYPETDTLVKHWVWDTHTYTCVHAHLEMYLYLIILYPYVLKFAVFFWATQEVETAWLLPLQGMTFCELFSSNDLEEVFQLWIFILNQSYQLYFQHSVANLGVPDYYQDLKWQNNSLQSICRVVSFARVFWSNNICVLRIPFLLGSLKTGGKNEKKWPNKNLIFFFVINSNSVYENMKNNICSKNLRLKNSRDRKRVCWWRSGFEKWKTVSGESWQTDWGKRGRREPGFISGQARC